MKIKFYLRFYVKIWLGILTYLWQRICFRAGGGILAFVENIWWEMKSAASGATTENFLQISYHLRIVQIYDHCRVIHIFKI